MFFSFAFNQVNVWVFWFWFHLNKVPGSDSSVSGQNLLSGMLCSVLFLFLSLLNSSKHIKFWLWFHLCSVYDTKVWILLLSIVVPPPDFEKKWFLLFSAIFCAYYHYIVALAYSCSVCSNLLTVIISDTQLASLVLIKLLTLKRC